jgi:hypothetical protein
MMLFVVALVSNDLFKAVLEADAVLQSTTDSL